VNRASSATTTRPSTWPTSRRASGRQRCPIVIVDARHQAYGRGDHSASGPVEPRVNGRAVPTAPIGVVADVRRRRRRRDRRRARPRRRRAGRTSCPAGARLRRGARSRTVGGPHRRVPGPDGLLRVLPKRAVRLRPAPNSRGRSGRAASRTGPQRRAEPSSGFTARDREAGCATHVRHRTPRGVHSPDGRELPMFDPPGAPAPRRPRARDDRDGRLGHARSGATRLDQVADAVGRELPRPQGPAPRPEPQHGLRGGPLPEHRGVLGPADRDDHDPRRHLHPGLRVLRGQDRPADVVRRRRAAPRRRGGRRARPRARRRDLGRRDDLPDGGSRIFAETITRCARRAPGWASRS
jgi:hypothetical protein